MSTIAQDDPKINKQLNTQPQPTRQPLPASQPSKLARVYAIIREAAAEVRATQDERDEVRA